MTQRQTCKACGRPDKFNFNVSDATWAAVVPARLRSRVVCLYCFDGFAARRGVAYADEMHEVWFAGDRAVFEFRPVTSITV